MQIAFDAKRLFHNNTGLGNYSRTLVTNLAKHYPELKLNLISPKIAKSNFLEPFSGEAFQHYEIPEPLSSFRRAYDYSSLIRRSKAQIFHGLSNELPLRIKKSRIPSVVSIHDLIHMTYPDDFRFLDRKIYAFKTLKACQNADKIVAISHSTKQDLIEKLDVPEHKIEMVYQSCAAIFQDQSTQHERPKDLASDYILYVGTINRRKNLLGLLQAYAQLKKSEQIPIIVVGSGGKEYVHEVKQFIQKNNLENHVQFMGSLPNQALKTLYQHARFFVFPSFYEGFGIPIIESLFSGTPVLSANNSSLIEATGPCGEIVEANEIDSIQEGLTKMICDDGLLRNFESNIPNHVAQFKSQQTTEAMMDVYRTLV